MNTALIQIQLKEIFSKIHSFVTDGIDISQNGMEDMMAEVWAHVEDVINE